MTDGIDDVLTAERKCWECGTKRWLRRIKLYTEEGDHLCYRWYDVCKTCRDNMAEDWPRGDNGRFLPSQECETAHV